LKGIGILGEITMLQYPATIKKTEGHYLVSFVDFENINTCGETLEHALKNAEGALNGCLESDFERGFRISDPSDKKGRNIYYILVKPHIAFSLMLRKLRAGRTQQEIAHKLKISFQVYQRPENPRKANPTIKTLEKVACAYGKHVTLDFL
jgi:antitoxin HicB